MKRPHVTTFLLLLFSFLLFSTGAAEEEPPSSSSSSSSESSECAAITESSARELAVEKQKTESCHVELSKTKTELKAREATLSELAKEKSGDSTEVLKLREVAQQQSEEVKGLKESLESERARYDALKKSSAAEIDALNGQLKTMRQRIESKESEKDQKFAAMQKNLADSEREIARLKDQLQASKSERQGQSGDGELEKKLEEARTLLEEERSKRSSMEDELQFFRQGVHVVAFHRGLEHLENGRTLLLGVYEETIKPKVAVAQASAAETYANAKAFMDKEILPKVYVELEKLEPQLKQVKEPYEKHVGPYVEVLWTKAGEVYETVVIPGVDEACSRAESGVEMLQDKFQEFRARGIRTLERNPTMAKNAVTIFDGCVFTILLLSTLLLGPFLLRLALKTAFFLFLLPFRVFCFCCCCGCCCRSRKTKTQAKPQKPQKPQKPAAKGGKEAAQQKKQK